MPVYLIIGSHKPECRELVERASQSRLEDIMPEPWQTVEGASNLPGEHHPDSTLICFLDPARNLADEIDTVLDWSGATGHSIDRVIGVIDTRAAEQSSTYAHWTEACAHFCDALLWGNRDEVSQKWLRAFQKAFQRRYLPCSFHFLKKGGKVEELLLVFYPEARRLSQVFDPPEDADAPKAVELLEIEASFDLDADEPAEIDDDPWLQRHESGQRRQQVPDIREWIVETDSPED